MINLNSLDLINDIKLNYKQDLSYPDEISGIAKEFSQKCNTLGLTFEGPVPTNILYNIKETKRHILDIDEDSLFVVVAKPGLGKTNVAFISAVFTQLGFNQQLIIFSYAELLDFLTLCALEMKKEENSTYISFMRGYSIIVDEAVDLFHSADTSTKEGKSKTKLLTVIRFFNLEIGCCATHYEKLNKTLRSRFRFCLRIVEKGIVEYYSPRLTRAILVDTDLTVTFPRPSFREKVGYFPKGQNFINIYNSRKGQFSANSIDMIKREVLSK